MTGTPFRTPPERRSPAVPADAQTRPDQTSTVLTVICGVSGHSCIASNGDLGAASCNATNGARPSWPTRCDWTGCTTVAANAVKFRGQPGHLHECGLHTAALREWVNVASVQPMPCPYAGCSGGPIRIDWPRPLR